MKKLIIAITLLVLTALAGGIFVFFAHIKQRERFAMVSVITQRNQGLKDSVHFQIVQKKRRVVVDKTYFLHCLMEIKTDECPKDFQGAWINYV
jgi:hypothetical protein